nr:uncharacterized protein LOC109158330 isoform X2 [Ipomoea batatas]GME17531.1 uncharacterized protein LOC109158330 isoform X2 [Ipomoea batatas]
MENPPRHRKSKRASGAFEGSKQVQKKIAAQRITYNSRCQYDSSANEDMFMIELGESASKRVIGKPMKKLIAEEMLNEVESKRKSPSIIARLMGLDGMPSPQQLSRQQRRLSESSRQGKEKIDSHRTVHLFVDQARRNSMDYHEFNDMNEDLEASHIANRRFSSRWSTKSGPNMDMPEMAVLQHEYLEATHLSTDEKLQSSKGFDDTLEEQESNDELLLKCLPQRDSLFPKHLLDLQVDTSSSMCSHIAVLKPATSANSEVTAILRKPERGGSWNHDINLQRKREDDHLFHLPNPHGGHSSFKSPKTHVKGKNENIFPTRIVVLKPNCGKTHCDVTSVQYPSEEKKLARRLNFGTGKTGFAEMKNSSKNAGLLSSHSKEAREIAKEITTRMRNTHGPLNVRKDLSLIYSDIVGYATDESSFDVYDNDSASEPEMLKLSSGKLYSRNNRCKSSSSATFESSVSREAKKRLSDRWKSTQRCQDMEIVNKGNTLGEMLSFPDRETEVVHLDTMVTLDGASDKFGGRTDGGENPLGISSRDGWKDVYVSSRSRSLSPLGSQIQGLSTRHEIVANSRNLRPRQLVNGIRPVDRSRIKSWDGSQSHTEEVLFNEIRSGRKKHRSSRRKTTGVNDTLQEAIFCKMMSTSVERNMSEQLLLASEMPVSKNAISVIDSAKHTEHESVISESSIDLIHQTFTESNETLFPDQDASDLQETSVQVAVPSQCPLPESESSESSREGGHPSPVSVLEEVTFTEDSLSGSECLEFVSAKINDLRKKIEQLKMKPESFADLTDDNQDVWHPATVIEEKCMLMSPSWESSYIDDVLTDSGFKESDLDAFTATCHSPYCPLSPSIFENLEKKYSDEVIGVPRYARRLLFDRVNLALVEILRHYVDPYPWLKHKRVANLVCQKQEVAGALHRLLADHDSVANRDTSWRILEREMRWLDVSDDINVIGKDIEKLLVDDLITEIIM